MRGRRPFQAWFDEGPLIVVDAPGPDTVVHVWGKIKQFNDKGYDHPLALSYSPQPGAGRVIYTTFHNDAQINNLMRKILYYLVFLM